LGVIEAKTAPRSGPEPAIETIQASKWWQTERPQTGKPWTTEEDNNLKTLAASGAAVETIAQELGRGLHGVEVRMSKLGVTPTQEPDLSS